MTLCSLPGGGGGTPFFWPKPVCAADYGMVFGVSSLKQGIQFYNLVS